MAQSKFIKKYKYATLKYKRYKVKLLKGMTEYIKVDRGVEEIYIYKINKKDIDKLKKKK